jgi:predicted lipoprotein
MKVNKIIVISILVFLILAVQCKEKPTENSPEKYDTKAMVTNVATNYIIPAYSNYKDETVTLLDLMNAFTSSPSELNLTNCQNQWKETALAWQNVAMLEFGPAEGMSLKAQTNIFPVDTTLIKSNIASNTYNLQLPSNFDAKGLQSLDYLLFLPAMTHAEIVTYYINTTNAKIYLTSVATELNTNATSVFNDWNTTYKTSFINTIESNAVGTSVSNMINALSLHFEAFVRKGKVGIPLGIFNGISQQTMPGHVEGLYSGNSIDLAVQTMQSIKDYLNGKTFNSSTNGEGLSDYLDFVKAQNNGQNLSVVIDDKIDLISTNLNALSPTINDAIINNNTAVHTVYQSMQQLVPLIKIDMTSNLGVLISYQDSDGD